VGRKLTVQVAKFYASVYESARSGSLGDLRRRGSSESEAEEIFAAVFERVMETVDPIERDFLPAQMVNFIKRACQRRLIDERRHQSVLREVELGDVQELSDTSAPGPDEIVEALEANAIGREALLALSEQDRIVFLQRYQMNLSPEEILENIPGLTQRAYRRAIQRGNRRVLAAFEQIHSGARCKEMEREMLVRFLASECSGKESEAVMAHLDHCRVCQLTQAQMRGYLHDVAGGLGAFLLVGSQGHGYFVDGLAQLVDHVVRGGQSIAEATQAGREKVRESILRLAGGLPGSGGDAAVGQALGATGVKVASACTAGVVAGACVAAGVVPGVGLIGSAGEKPAKPARVIEDVSTPSHPPVSSAPAPESAETETQVRPSGPSQAKERERSTRVKPKTARAKPVQPPTLRSQARESGRQTGTEFGIEASPPPPPEAPPPTPTSPSQGSSKGGSTSRPRAASPTW
jgi:RNA polymerase sigma factor (sigma-70 family)